MSSTKFDEADRKRVIRAVEARFNVKLRPVGRRRKWLLDNAGRNYWVLGGYEEWHGIPEEMMRAERSAAVEGILVVAARKKSSMTVFAGSVTGLVRCADKLYRAKKTTGDFQFTYKVRGEHLFVDQLSGFSLERIDSVQYDADEKQRDKTAEEVKKLLESMPSEERAALVNRWIQKT